jgi:tetratricopeptide (TPR) repeat protein
LLFGNALQSQGKTDEAAAEFRAAIAIDPKDKVALNAIAWFWATTPDLDGQYPHAAEAVLHAQEAVRLDPEDAGIVNTLGVALYRTNNWTEAIETLQKTIELGSDNAHNWLFLAMSNWQLDNKPEARTWYEKSTIWRETNAARVEDDPELQAFFTEAETLLKNPKE